MDAAFKAGDIVERVNQPEAIGVVLEACWDEQTESWTYKVQFGSVVTAVPESSIRGWKAATTSWAKIHASKFSGIEHFRDTLTYHKVKTPTARVAYAYATARTTFYPHQFKPLLKFLDGGGSGLLIADDVGLGKTIEAGYILRELEARKRLDRVVVLVPARLATKWKREMAQRFEETFEIVKGNNLIELANTLERGRELPPFKWIVSYEGARLASVQEALSSARPTIDLLIVDEAHRLRNSETLQHKLGKLLCDLADYRIFLTATPVQNSLDDLWNLLKLLSEDQFPDRELFAKQVIANRKILESQQYLSRNPPNFYEASRALAKISASDGNSVPASDEFLQSIFQRLESKDMSSSDIAELHSDIAQLNTLGHIVSRTRKSDAMPGCARREAVWSRVELTRPEQQIYNSVERLCRKRPSQDSVQSWGYQMATIMAYRATASCIPAAIHYFEEKLERSRADNVQDVNYYFEAGEMAVDSPNRGDSETGLSNWFDSQRDRLAELVEYWRSSGGIDSKFGRLQEVLESIWEADDQLNVPRRKVIIFSFFRKTLEYLNHALADLGINARMIHGLISMPDRDDAIDDFLTRPDVQVLLTSEVGGEGIDLQEASVVLNYDLPWNPMVVEQRIGRVDRIGQQAERIVIVNFVVAGSIEEKILQRLLNKIGIFESSIGEIDPIIGDEIETLTRESVSGMLSDEELEHKIVLEERAIASRVVAANLIKNEAENLFTSDQSLLDEIGALIGERQVPGEIDLWRFLNRFFGDNYAGHVISNQALKAVVGTRFSPKMASEMEEAPRELGSDLSLFGRKAAVSEIPLTLSREIAYRTATADLIHFSHPLVKFAVWKLGSRFGNEAFCLSLAESKVLQPGLYGFAIRMAEMDGPIQRNRMLVAFTEIEGNRFWSKKTETNRLLLEILECGKSEYPDPLQVKLGETIEARLNAELDSNLREVETREIQFAEGRLAQRRAISIRLAEMKLRRAQDQLDRMVASQAKEFAIKMGGLKIRKAAEELDSQKSLESKPTSIGVKAWTDIAAGFLRVGI